MINLIYSKKGKPSTIRMQCTIFLILPTWAVFFAFSLPPSVDPTYISVTSTNGKQDVLEQMVEQRIHPCHTAAILDMTYVL